MKDIRKKGLADMTPDQLGMIFIPICIAVVLIASAIKGIVSPDCEKEHTTQEGSE